MLTLGIPSNPTMALMIGALMIQGIAPGPQVMTERPALFWGLIASMWIGNLMLLVLNLPLVGLWVRLVAVPYRLLFPRSSCSAASGSTPSTTRSSTSTRWRRWRRSATCCSSSTASRRRMVLGFILGPMMEENLRRAMMISFGDPTVFVTRPLSAAFLAAAALLLAAIALPALRAKREEAMQE